MWLSRDTPTTWQLAIACGILLAFVTVLAAVGEPTLNSGSDAGGKSATVSAIAIDGLGGVDLGYWAASADPDGVHHPIVKTTRFGDNWIQVTSAVLPTAAAAGERAGGPIGALWLSLLAVPFGALGARRLSRVLGSASGWPAFWLVGAASPLTFYGLDQWEHGPALACGLWAVALILGRVSGRQIVAGAALAALAMSLRRELAFVFLAILVLEMVRPEGRRHWLSQWRSVGIGAAVAAFIGGALIRFDQAVLARNGAGRSVAQAQIAGQDLGQRFEDAFLTTIGLFPSTDPMLLVLSVVPLVGLALAAQGARDDDRFRELVGVALVAVALVVRVGGGGLGFVPGAVAVLPLIVVGPVLAPRRVRGLFLASSLAIIGVLIFQWTGSLAAQWGGRYLLLPAAVMAVAAVVELEQIGWRRPLTLTALGATGIIAATGLAYHVERTRAVDQTRDEIALAIQDDVLISTHSHIPREMAFTALEGRWLRADQAEDVGLALATAAEVADPERVWLLHTGVCAEPCERRWAEQDSAGDLDGWVSGEVIEVRWLDRTYVLESFSRALNDDTESTG